MVEDLVNAFVDLWRLLYDWEQHCEWIISYFGLGWNWSHEERNKLLGNSCVVIRDLEYKILDYEIMIEEHFDWYKGY